MTPDTPIEQTGRLSPPQKKALDRLGIKTIKDLLYHFPTRYGSTAEARRIKDLVPGEEAAIFGTVKKIETKKSFRSRIPMGKATIEDETGLIDIVWFNQPYLAKMISKGSIVKVQGKVSDKNGMLSFANPHIEEIGEMPEIVGKSLFGEGGDSILYPVYRETRGLTSRWIFHKLQKIFSEHVHESIEDPIPPEILETYKLPTLKTALVWIHAPKKQSDALAARKRFSFEEIFFIQLARQKNRALWNKEEAFTIDKKLEDLKPLLKELGFPLTEGQEKSVKTILKDFKKGEPMARLLEGDVGSGKTAVGALATYAVLTSHPKENPSARLQTAYMVPTEILARQQFENFIQFFVGTGVQIGLLTGKTCLKFPSKVNPREATPISKAQLKKWCASGEIGVLVGTHALIQKTVSFKHLAFAIIDEQHRFGTNQRQKLIQKDGFTPHLLSMTATPIPRSLALTLYGDLDLSILDTLPPGRKPVVTNVIPKEKRDETYSFIEEKLKEGRQLYVICPRINEPDESKEKAVQAKSAIEEAKRLKKDVFPKWNIGLIHGKMKPKEKEAVMQDFADKKIDILVATSVIEVGINVENATMIIIEGAERFGLSQLHQLRGRVMRSTYEPYCFVFVESSSEKTIRRMKSFVSAKNGFELAEHDLKERGPGELVGIRQWGMSDIGMEALQNIKMVEAAREEAKTLIEKDPELALYSSLLKQIEKYNDAHFE